MKFKWIPLVLCLLAGGVSAQDVSAGQAQGPQEPAPASVRRPYRGIFGGPPDPDTPQSLVLSASAFGAYDENVLAGITDRPTVLDPRLQRSGYYSGAQTGLHYALSKTRQRASFQAFSDAQAAVYRSRATDTFSPQYDGGVAFTVPLGRTTTFGASQSVAYSKYYRFVLFPGVEGLDNVDDAVATDPSLELLSRAAIGYTTNAVLTRRLSTRSSVSAEYRRREVNYLDRQFADFGGQSAAVLFRRQITAHATLNLGYRYRVVDPTTLNSVARTAHDVDAGVDYGRALSISRRTFVSFSTGSTILVRDAVSGTSNSDSRLHVRLIGNAALRHELGRTWSLDATYRRGVAFHEGFNEPFFVDTATAGVGGLFTRRLDFSAVARWSFATLDRGRNSDHRAVSATAQSRYALTRYLAVFVRYAYYRYRFGAEVPLDNELPRELNRNGVRVGLTASVPLIR
jgi:hypothetical protein